VLPTLQQQQQRQQQQQQHLFVSGRHRMQHIGSGIKDAVLQCYCWHSMLCLHQP
jgi:hypothetical protein